MRLRDNRTTLDLDSDFNMEGSRNVGNYKILGRIYIKLCNPDKAVDTGTDRSVDRSIANSAVLF